MLCGRPGTRAENICGSWPLPIFGLRSQWLDMTSYDHDENFGLYFAVLKKTDASPLLPESDEDRGVGTGSRRLQPGACAGDVPAGGEAGGGEGSGQQRGQRGPV